MSRALRTAATLAVLSLILVVMSVVGWQKTTAGFPSLSGDRGTKTPCSSEQVKKRITRKEVAVSVFNGSGRAGLANRTMDELERRSFRVGTIGNAPAGTSVKGVEVRVGSASDPSAKLVAAQFRPAAAVVASGDDLGAGVDVIMGTGSRVPRGNGPAFLKLDKPVVLCLDKPSANPSG